MDKARRAALQQGWTHGLGCTLGRPGRTPAGATGERLGHRVGSSIEFMDYRDYAPGDDLRRLDWAAYARSDRLMVRLHREEVTPHVDVLVDATDSMALADTPKQAATLGLTALLCGAAENTRWSRRVFALRAGDDASPLAGVEVAGGSGEPAGWTLEAEGSAFGVSQDAVGEITLRRRGLRVVVSDLLFEADPDALVSRWVDGAAGLWVVQLLALQDADPSAALGFDGDVRLVDAEAGGLQEVRLDAAALQRYRDALAAHTARWTDALGRVGGRLVTVVAEELLDGWDTRSLMRAGVLEAR